MSKRLSDAEIARYHRDGFLYPIDPCNPECRRGCRMKRASTLICLIAVLVVAGCTPVDPRTQTNVQMETGHVDSGGAGGGGGM
jgi:hypothetical protein